MLLGQLGLCTARWRMLVGPGLPTPGFVDSYFAFIEGHFFNQVLPSTIAGDSWRAVRWRASGVGLRAAVASIFLDRLSGATGAAILAILASVLLLRQGVDGYLVLSIFLLGVLVIAATGLFFLLIHHSGFFLFRRLPRVQSAIAYLHNALVLDRRFVGSLGYAIAGHCVCGIAVYVTAISLGVGLSLALIVSVTACVLLITMIPISLGGWGLREASFITLLGPLGVNSQESLLIGILFGLMTLVSALPGGLAFLANRRPLDVKAQETVQS